MERLLNFPDLIDANECGTVDAQEFLMIKRSRASTLENTEVALRAYRDLAGFDLSFYFYRGFFRQPSARPEDPAFVFLFLQPLRSLIIC